MKGFPAKNNLEFFLHVKKGISSKLLEGKTSSVVEIFEEFLFKEMKIDTKLVSVAA